MTSCRSHIKPIPAMKLIARIRASVMSCWCGMFVKKFCMNDACSNGVIGHTLIPGIKGQSDICPSMLIAMPVWNMPNIERYRSVKTPNERRMCPILGVNEAITIKYTP